MGHKYALSFVVQALQLCALRRAHPRDLASPPSSLSPPRLCALLPPLSPPRCPEALPVPMIGHADDGPRPPRAPSQLPRVGGLHDQVEDVAEVDEHEVGVRYVLDACKRPKGSVRNKQPQNPQPNTEGRPRTAAKRRHHQQAVAWPRLGPLLHLARLDEPDGRSVRRRDRQVEEWLRLRQRFRR